MGTRKSTWLGLAPAILVAATALGGANDVWLTTKARIALLTCDGVSATGVSIDAVDGVVTIRGKVKTGAEKDKATLAVRSVDGVKSVQNLLRVGPDAFKVSLKATDEAIKGSVETALKADKRVEGVTVAGVNNGVVLLSGRTGTVAEKLRAIELAWSAAGVSRVVSEIEAEDK